jgi:heme/copper-type cytochrome/quinol oxidase subunit 2
MTTILVISLLISFVASLLLAITRDTMNEFTNLPEDNSITPIEFICCFIPCCNLFIILSITLEFVRQFHKQNIQNQYNKYHTENTIETILDNK